MDWNLWVLAGRGLDIVRVSSSETSSSGQAGSGASGLKAGGCGEGLVAPSCTRTNYTQIYSPNKRLSDPAWEQGVSGTSDGERRAFKKTSAIFNSQTEKQSLKAGVMAKWGVLPNLWQSEALTCCKCDAFTGGYVLLFQHWRMGLHFAHKTVCGGG